jgi:hypothetical protein
MYTTKAQKRMSETGSNIMMIPPNQDRDIAEVEFFCYACVSMFYLYMALFLSSHK